MTGGLFGVVLAMAFFCAAPIARAGTIPAPTRVFDEIKDAKTSEIVLAGGCFWCTEAVFQSLKGVVSVESGYSGGNKDDAAYDNVSAGNTGHAEAVRIVYNPHEVGLGRILQVFFGVAHNPTQLNRQGNDIGTQYRSAIFVKTDAQQKYVSDYIAELTASKYFPAPIVTTIEKFAAFYPAEAYHQDYAARNGDNPYIQSQALPKLEKLKKFSLETEGEKEAAIDFFADKKNKLTKMQCHVTLEDGTEPAFNNAYWNNHADGIYVDVISGEPLFSSTDKFDSGSGWPSFTRPISEHTIAEKKDNRYGMERIEVRSTKADAHLGHIFDDGPKDKGGLRYCINSAALRFVPKADLEKEGLGQYLPLFEKK